MNKLHPGAIWQFRVAGYFLFGVLGLFFGFWTMIPIGAVVLSLLGVSPGAISMVVLLGILGFIAFVLIATEIYAQMSYNRWFWEFNEEGLRLERGIIWKRYSNIPYERIQNVDITRGIIARICGFSTLHVQTAGYSAVPNAEGGIPALAIDEAENIRSMLMKRITSRRK